MLVVHSERVYLDIVVSEKLNSLLEGWSRVGRFQRAEGDNVNVSPPALTWKYLVPDVQTSGRSSIIKVDRPRPRHIIEIERLHQGGRVILV